MIGSSRSYAIGMAHFQIAGGWKTLGIICASYIVAVLSIASSIYYDAVSSKVPGPVFTGAAVALLTVVEMMLLLLFGMLRIAGAVRLDITTKMLESHRLMPISNGRAAVGYVMGATAHAIALALLNFVLVYIFAGITGADLARVTLDQAVLALFVLFVWSASLLGAFHGKVYGAMIAVISPIGGAFMYKLLPGLALLISPLMGDTIFHVGLTARHLEIPYAAAFVAQILFAVIFFSGACRAYRGTYATTFNLAEALGLTCVWSALSIVGIALWESFHARIFYPYREDPQIHSQQAIASLIAAMLIALVPIRTLTLIELRRKVHPLVSVLFLGAIAATITVIPVGLSPLAANSAMYNLQGVVTGRHFQITAVVIAAHVATAYLIFRIMRRAKGAPTFLAIAIVGFGLWIVPILVELIRMWVSVPVTTDVETHAGMVSAFSPVALLAFVWTPDTKVRVMGGLVWIVAVPVVLGVMVVTQRNKKVAVVGVPLTSPLLTPSASAVRTADPPESSRS
jgi:hypothetical protein